MPFYHTMLEGGRVVKWNTVLAENPHRAILKAYEQWLYSGGEQISKQIVCKYENGDPEYGYQWAPPDTFVDRKNLLDVE